MKTLSAGILFFSWCLLFSSPSFGLNQGQDQPTDISSHKMTYSGQDNLVVFKGNVHVLRPDFQLWSDELHVFLKPGPDSDSPGQQENIEKIVASGNVRIQSNDRTGYSQLLTYFPDTGTARLEDNPRLVEGQNSVEGETIILNMYENTSEVLGGPEKRVRVIFHSESSAGE